MNTAKVFRTGRSQAVRLPKKYRFNAAEVIVNKVGDMVILFPRNKAWGTLARGLERFTQDFLADRAQPAQSDKREEL